MGVDKGGCLRRLTGGDFEESMIGTKRKRWGEESEESRAGKKREMSLETAYRTCCEALSRVEQQYVETDAELHRYIGAIRHFETQAFVSCESNSCTLCGYDFASEAVRTRWLRRYQEKIRLNKRHLEKSEAVKRHRVCIRVLSSRTDELRKKPERVKDLLSGRLEALSVQGAFTLRESRCSVCRRDLSPKQLEVFHDVLERRLSVITARIATKYSAHTV